MTDHITTLNTDVVAADLTLTPLENNRLSNFCGPVDQNIRLIEKILSLRILLRDNHLKIVGPLKNVKIAEQVILKLYQDAGRGALGLQYIEQLLKNNINPADTPWKEISLNVKGKSYKARNENQSCYIKALHKYDINFSIGPAGTGKTYIAVVRACELLERQEISRIVLVRPAVEAGEKLGFLPGNINDKVNPYLRPLYDALYEVLGFEEVNKLIERNIIEIASLAYMRGRTLNDSCVIMDESQNTTVAQMKMLLTRLGFNSKAIITGDLSQIDLPRGELSGLKHALQILANIPGINFSYFENNDVVRHPLIKKILACYDNEVKSRHTIESENQHIPNSDNFIKIVSESLLFNDISMAELCIRVVTNAEITELNCNYRNKKKPTNVLSFPFDVDPEFNENNYLGDIVIAADIVEQEARENNKEIYDHWVHMVTHGVLHLLGFDHIDNLDAEKMEGCEIEILKKLGVKNPYK